MLLQDLGRRLWVASLVSCVALGLMPPAASAAAAVGSPRALDPTRPTSMEAAAATAAAPPTHTLAPFRQAPPLRPRTAERIAATSGAAVPAGPTREVFGFVNAANLADPQLGYTTWNFSDLSTVAFFGLDVNSADGTLVTTDTGWSEWNSSDLTNLVTAAHNAGVRVVVSVILQDFSNGNATMCAGLQHASTTISAVVAQVSAKGIDGVNVDYEGINATCGSSTTAAMLTSFVAQLRGSMPAGSYLSIDTYASSAGSPGGFFDVAGLAGSVDSFFVMAYDLDQSNFSAPPISCSTYCMNPVAPLTAYEFNDTDTASQYAGVVAPSKVILGVPYFGRTGCAASLGQPRPGANAVETPGTLSTPRYIDSVATPTAAGVSGFSAARDVHDAPGQVPFATWMSDAAHFNCWRESYWDDPTSLSQKYALVAQDGLRGVGLFALDYGGGAPELWAAITQAFGFQSLGGTVTSPPAVTSWAPGRLDAFVRWTDASLWHAGASGGAWSGWENLGGSFTGAPAVASWGPNRLDAFVRGPDNSLWHKAWQGTSWSGWESLGGSISASPAVVAAAFNRLDVLVRGSGGDLWTIGWTGSAWSWKGLGGGILGSPAVASWSSDRLDVFVRGGGGSLWHKARSAGNWGAWDSLGGVLSADPSVVSWGPNRLDALGRGPNGTSWDMAWNGSAWTGWQPLGGFLAAGPTAATTGPGHLDVYGLGGGNSLWHVLGNGASWGGWIPLGGSWAADPPAVAVQSGSGRVDAFVVGTAGDVWHARV
jgi:spore germination protein YaaH